MKESEWGLGGFGCAKRVSQCQHLCGLLIGQTSISLGFKGHAIPVGVILALEDWGGIFGVRAALCLSVVALSPPSLNFSGLWWEPQSLNWVNTATNTSTPEASPNAMPAGLSSTLRPRQDV
jgi:hypothetical protein